MKTRTAVIASALGAAGCAGAMLLVWWARPPARPGPTITIIVSADGSPSANEQNVLPSIEQAVSAAHGVKRIRSEARSGETTTEVLFDRSVDPITAAEEVRQAIQTILKQLPAGSVPLIHRAAPAQDVLWAVGGAHLDRQLEVVAGVGAVEVCGETEERIRVVLDPARLTAMSIGLDVVLHALQPSYSTAFALSAQHRLPDPMGLAETILTTRAAAPVLLKDVATVSVRRASTGCETSGLAERELLARVSLQDGASRAEVMKRLEPKAREIGARLFDPERTIALALDVPREGRQGILQPLLTDLRGVPGITAAVATRHDERDDGVEILLTVDRAIVKRNPPELRARATADRPGVVWRGLRASPFGTPPVLTVTLVGPDLEALDTQARAARTKLQPLAGVGPYVGADSLPVPQLEVTLDRDLAARLGIQTSDIDQTLHASLAGIPLMDRLTVYLGEPGSVATPEALQRIVVHGVPLATVTKLESRPLSKAVLHVDRQRAVELRWETEPGFAIETVERALSGTPARIELSDLRR